MHLTVETSLMFIAVFAGLWAAFYAHRAYGNTKKILDKLNK
jgi:hypothetical protein